MPYPADPRRQTALEAAHALLGARPDAVAPVLGGGNSQVFRIATDGRSLALKLYAPPAPDRDRRANEWAALSLLASQGVEEVPQPIATDPRLNATLLEWLDGAPIPPERIGPEHLRAALAFAARLQDIGRICDKDDVGSATEACLSLNDLLGQIARRRARLLEIDDPALAAFLRDEATPALENAHRRAGEIYAANGWESDQPLSRVAQTLSPSDFGFHNALIDAAGRIRFLDFEYFGWDDPVKLTADFLLHPGMTLNQESRRRFRNGAEALFAAGDPDFTPRLDALRPLYALRWTLIVLNEFLPERWAARVAAGMSESRPAALQRQLAKAQTLVSLARQTPPTA